MFGFLATAVAKLASLSVATQAAAGITVAVAGVGGVAVAGDLPAPVQNAVASVVSSVTPISLQHTTTSTQDSTTTTAGTSDTSSTGGTADSSTSATDAPAATTPSLPSQAAFGQSVAAAAKSGGVDGQTISARARATHQPAQAAAHRPTQPAPDQATQAPGSSTAPVAPVHGKPATVGSGRP